MTLIQNPTSKFCVDCEMELSADQFYKSHRGHLIKYCKPCSKKRNRWRKTSLRERGLCSICGQQPKRQESSQCQECWELERARTKVWRTSIMRDILNLYGGKCACCGELNPKFLTIDHVNNDGYAERRTSGATNKGGYTFYIRILKLGYIRNDLQVLCYNCNMGKARNGGVCPHAQNN